MPERIRRATHWLEQTPAQTHTNQAFRLLGLAWGDGQPTVLQQGIEDLLRTQKEDGGWSQLANLDSDAWATGLALLAVHPAGLETTHPAYRRGVEFLLKRSLRMDPGLSGVAPTLPYRTSTVTFLSAKIIRF